MTKGLTERKIDAIESVGIAIAGLAEQLHAGARMVANAIASTAALDDVLDGVRDRPTAEHYHGPVFDGCTFSHGVVVAPDGVRRCRRCGCTDDEACDGGCTWVAADLCSSCVDEFAAVRLTEHVDDVDARIVDTHYGRSQGAPSVCGPVDDDDQITDQPELVTCRECALVLVHDLGEHIARQAAILGAAQADLEEYESFTRDVQQHRQALAQEVTRLHAKVENLSNENGDLRRQVHLADLYEIQVGKLLDGLQMDIDQRCADVARPTEPNHGDAAEHWLTAVLLTEFAGRGGSRYRIPSERMAEALVYRIGVDRDLTTGSVDLWLRPQPATPSRGDQEGHAPERPASTVAPTGHPALHPPEHTFEGHGWSDRCGRCGYPVGDRQRHVLVGDDQ